MSIEANGYADGAGLFAEAEDAVQEGSDFRGEGREHAINSASGR